MKSVYTSLSFPLPPTPPGYKSVSLNAFFFLQKLILSKVKSVLANCIEELFRSTVPKCARVADLGCSSGPNTFVSILEIIQGIDKASQQINQEQPLMIQVFLNDLYGNDFNAVFKSLPSFYEKLEKVNGRKHGSCLIAAMPGSFYGRLFPKSSMHVLHSSYCVHWLSQVCETLYFSF